MLRWAFREARWRLAVGGAIALTTPAWLPDAPSPRLWSLAAFALLAPWLVLGRDARRVEADLRTPLASTRGLPRWVAAELAPPLLVVAAGALVGTGLDLPAAAPLFAWGAFLVCLADALDRRSARAGAAWVGVLVVGLVVLAAPLWVAGWLGGASHWPGTLAVGLHPAAAALAGSGHATLQDPLLYRWSLSGVVEVRPLPWWPAVVAFLALAAVASWGAVQSARRPVTAWAGGARARSRAPMTLEAER
ncbi:MAG: hypothetical protein R3F60_05015 [bacterium]